MDDEKFLDPNQLNILPPSKFAPSKSGRGILPTPKEISGFPAKTDSKSLGLSETPPWMKSASSLSSSSSERINYGSSSSKSLLQKFSSSQAQEQKDLAYGSRSSRPSSSDMTVRHIAPANYGHAQLPSSKSRTGESVWTKSSSHKPPEPARSGSEVPDNSSSSQVSSRTGLDDIAPTSFGAIHTNRSIQKRVMERMGKLQSAGEVPEKKAYKTHNEAFYGLQKAMGTDNPAEATHVVEKMVDPKYGSFCS